MKLNVMFISVFLLSGCMTAPRQSVLDTMKTETPVNVTHLNLAPVGVGQIKVSMEQKKIGNYHTTVLPLLPGLHTKTYSNVRELPPELLSTYQRLIADELTEVGYDVAGREQLFVKPDTDRARFLIAAEISDATWDSYEGAGFKTIGSMRLDWQVYDVVRKTVIFKATTSGKDWVQNSDGVGLSYKILSNALRNLLAKNDLVQALTEASK